MARSQITAAAFLGLGTLRDADGTPRRGRVSAHGLEPDSATGRGSRSPVVRSPVVPAGPLPAGVAVRVATNPRDAARGVNVVVTCVADGKALEDVLGGTDGLLAGLEPDTLVIDMSTIGGPRPARPRER